MEKLQKTPVDKMHISTDYEGLITTEISSTQLQHLEPRNMVKAGSERLEIVRSREPGGLL